MNKLMSPFRRIIVFYSFHFSQVGECYTSAKVQYGSIASEVWEIHLLGKWSTAIS